MSDTEAILRWLLAVSVISYVLLPVVLWLARDLGPLAVGLARPLGVILLTAFVWWPAAMLRLPFSTVSLAAALLLIGIPGWWLAIRDQVLRRVDLRIWITFEVTWIALFLLYAWFRSYQPAIINTEKPMEIALLTAVSRSTDVPAPDPWLAGYGINYYYFGYQTISSLVRLSGVPASTGFNLALGTLFASSAVVGATIAAQILRLCKARALAVVTGSVVAPVLLLLAGNLETSRRMLHAFRGTIDASWWQGVGWQASRVIVDHNIHQTGDLAETINEFPAFSFILGDLHPHVLSFPLLGTIVALSVMTFDGAQPPARQRLVAIGALTGLLYASNSWDAPTAVLLVATAILGSRMISLRERIGSVISVLAGTLFGALPFLLQFKAPVGVPNTSLPSGIVDLPILGRIVSTFGIVTWHPSNVSELLTVHGAWLLVFATFAIWWGTRNVERLQVLMHYRHVLLVCGLLILGVGVAWSPALPLIGIPAACAFWIAWTDDESGIRALAGLFGIGFLLILLPEFVFIQDVFGNRMNTIFKLYFQAWLILSVASAGAIVIVISRVRRAWQPILSLAAAMLITLTLTYTPLSATDWSEHFRTRQGLNGEAYLQQSAASDYAVIAWLRDTATMGDTIVEAPGCSYAVVAGAPMDRISAFTGIPTVIGWRSHEYQWRRGEFDNADLVLNMRVTQANRILDGDVTPTATDARFIILGDQEMHGAAECQEVQTRAANVREKLERAGWVIGFQSTNTFVYVRPDDAIFEKTR